MLPENFADALKDEQSAHSALSRRPLQSTITLGGCHGYEAYLGLDCRPANGRRNFLFSLLRSLGLGCLQAARAKEANSEPIPKGEQTEQSPDSRRIAGRGRVAGYGRITDYRRIAAMEGPPVAEDDQCQCQDFCGTAFCGPPGRVWLRADYLMWFTTGTRLPPLVTTSPQGTPANQAGVLGAPGTTILFGGSDGLRRRPVGLPHDARVVARRLPYLGRGVRLLFAWASRPATLTRPPSATPSWPARSSTYPAPTRRQVNPAAGKPVGGLPRRGQWHDRGRRRKLLSVGRRT